MSTKSAPNRIRRDWLAVSVSIVSLIISALAYLNASRSATLQQYDYAPKIQFVNEQGSYVDPTRDGTPGPVAERALKSFREAGASPRWFTYETDIKNVGNRPIQVYSAVGCLRPTGTTECVGFYDMNDRDFYLAPAESRHVAFKPTEMLLTADDPFVKFDNVDILFVLRVHGADGSLVPIERLIGGFQGTKPVLHVK